MVSENIPPALVSLVVPVAGLRPHPRNPRIGDVERIAESLQRFGQTKPVVVQAATGYIVAGNHVFAAAKRLGWKRIAASVEDLDDDTASAYLLADNRTNDLGGYDRDVLADLLRGGLDNLAGTGYQRDEAEAIIAERVKSDVGEWASEAFTSHLKFESKAQFDHWYRFLDLMRTRYPDGTHGSRIARFIGEAMDA